MQKRPIILSFIFILALQTACGQITPGAERLDQYLPLLQGKQVGLVMNQSSRVGNTLLVDTLLSQNVKVAKIMVPEHGFRGTADAGVQVDNSSDAKTGLPIVSLYGRHKKPTPEDLQDLDVVVYDLQDVGTRFYTYLSTLHLVMQACAEQGVPLIVLDRPNPNGDYVDGPVLEEAYHSFVGMHPIPIVHGMTLGELAQMINGEGWLGDSLTCALTVVPVGHYDHTMAYTLPVKPSPNLPNQQAIRWYPSLCLFEGTMMSVGRGTTFPFQTVGYPDAKMGDFQFTPVSMPGMSLHPKYEGKTCYGIDLRTAPPPHKIALSYLIDFYQKASDKEQFFNAYFTKLAGTKALADQIRAGFSEAEIRMSWQPALKAFKQIRKKYLLYKDFE